MTFWYGTDPDQRVTDPDPALSVAGFQDVNKEEEKLMKPWKKLLQHRYRGDRLSSIYGSFDYKYFIGTEIPAHTLCVCRHKIVFFSAKL